MITNSEIKKNRMIDFFELLLIKQLKKRQKLRRIKKMWLRLKSFWSKISGNDRQVANPAYTHCQLCGVYLILKF